MTSVRVLPILALCIASFTACAPQQQASQPASTSSSTAGIAPQHTAQFIPASQNDPAHYRFTLPNGWMDAYPDWPNLDHLMIHYSNGDTIWGKPLYGTSNYRTATHAGRRSST